MIRMTEPMPCPTCRALVIPPAALGEPWYDYIDVGRHGTCGPAHICPGFTCRYVEAQPDMRRDQLAERIEVDDDDWEPSESDFGREAP